MLDGYYAYAAGAHVGPYPFLSPTIQADFLGWSGLTNGNGSPIFDPEDLPVDDFYRTCFWALDEHRHEEALEWNVTLEFEERPEEVRVDIEYERDMGRVFFETRPPKAINPSRDSSSRVREG